MAKYMVQATYSQSGVKGVLERGGSARRAAWEQLTREIGGKLESFYYTFGEDDVALIVEAPDNISMAGALLAVGAAGAATRIRTTVLLTPEEIDQATQEKVAYRAPGQ